LGLSAVSVGVQRIGIYGGAFDPPHLAHQALARAATTQLELNQLLILPTGQAWHKSHQPTDAAHRINMARLAFAEIPQVQVDIRETLRSGPTYTIDTLTELQLENPSATFFLLMGSDQFNAFTQWHRWQDIAKIATVCIAARAISISEKASKGIENQVQTACKIVNIQMPSMTTSATDIRKRVSHGLSIDHLVNPSVARYIAQHGLYTNTI
jgi:nicotinate-nucleotide adenylyltransferase